MRCSKSFGWEEVQIQLHHLQSQARHSFVRASANHKDHQLSIFHENSSCTSALLDSASGRDCQESKKVGDDKLLILRQSGPVEGIVSK